jgi:hypothetical protein
MGRAVKDLHPEVAYRLAKLEAACMALGIHIFLTDGYRSSIEQNHLYAKGRTKPGKKVTKAKAGKSWHNTKKNELPMARAIDIRFRKPFKNDKQGRPDYKSYWAKPPERLMKLVADMCIQLGFEVGYYWPSPDKPHAEFHPGFIRIKDKPLAGQIKDYCERN